MWVLKKEKRFYKNISYNFVIETGDKTDIILKSDILLLLKFRGFFDSLVFKYLWLFNLKLEGKKLLKYHWRK